MKKKNKIENSEQAARIACAKKTSIGGQALMEGIMMRGPKKSAMAVRDPHGEIVLEVTDISTGKRPLISKIPIARGVYGFISSMVIGYKSLMRSAEISGLEDIEEELAKEKAAKKAAKKAKKKGDVVTVEEEPEVATVPEAPQVDNEPDEVIEVPAKEELIAEDGEPVEVLEVLPKEEIITPESIADEPEAESKTEQASTPKAAPAKKEKKKSSGLTAMISILAGVIGVVFAIGLFAVLPSLISSGLDENIALKLAPVEGVWQALLANGLGGFLADKIAPGLDWVSWVLSSVISGVMRIIILVIYMSLVSLMKDIRRTFEYHGAEHKTIFCYESGLELTVENVRKQRRFHPRCGTSFLILMLLISIAMGIGAEMAYVGIIGTEATGIVITIIKICLLPLTMGIGYELIKFAGRHDNIITRIISAPGMWLQRLTVKEPTDDMIECAIVAFKAVVPDDNSDNY